LKCGAPRVAEKKKKRKEKGKDETMKAGKVLGKRRKTKTKQNRKKTTRMSVD